MSALQKRTQEIVEEYWAAREDPNPRKRMTERLAVAQLCIGLAARDLEIARLKAELAVGGAPTRAQYPEDPR